MAWEEVPEGMAAAWVEALAALAARAEAVKPEGQTVVMVATEGSEELRAAWEELRAAWEEVPEGIRSPACRTRCKCQDSR